MHTLWVFESSLTTTTEKSIYGTGWSVYCVQIDWRFNGPYFGLEDRIRQAKSTLSLLEGKGYIHYKSFVVKPEDKISWVSVQGISVDRSSQSIPDVLNKKGPRW